MDNPLIYYRFLTFSDYDTIINWCRSHRLGQIVCRDHIFWENKAQIDFNVSKEEFRKTHLSPAQRYFQLLLEKSTHVFSDMNRYFSLNAFVEECFSRGRYDYIEIAINIGFDSWDILVYQYAKIGDINKMNYWISKMAKKPHQAILFGFLTGGHKDLFDRALMDVPNNYELYWTGLASGAASSHNKDLLNYVISKAPTDTKWIWNRILYGAIDSKDIEMFKYILEKAPTNYEWNWILIIPRSIVNGGKEFYNKILVHIPIVPSTALIIDSIASAIAKTGDKDAFSNFIKLYDRYWDLNGILASAAQKGQVEMFDFILLMVSPQYQIQWNHIMDLAIFGGIGMINHVKSLAPIQFQWNGKIMINSSIGAKYERKYAQTFIPNLEDSF